MSPVLAACVAATGCKRLALSGWFQFQILERPPWLSRSPADRIDLGRVDRWRRHNGEWKELQNYIELEKGGKERKGKEGREKKEVGSMKEGKPTGFKAKSSKRLVSQMFLIPVDNNIGTSFFSSSSAWPSSNLLVSQCTSIYRNHFQIPESN